METNNKFNVGVVKIGKIQYPKISPYHPSENYPEYPFGKYLSKEPNYVYSGIRKLLLELGYDSKNQGGPQWNPLGNFIKPGDCVVIKPNFVLSNHAEGKDIYSIITHPSVIRAVIDYCWISLKGKGEIIIADAPQYDCNFKELLNITKLGNIKSFTNCFTGPTVEIYDLRNYWAKGRHFYSNMRKLRGDPMGSLKINLGTRSSFYNYHNLPKVYGAFYDRQETIKHHRGKRQLYEISKTLLSADVFISVPKLKVHKKVGVTLNHKNLVGICTNKNWIVHYTLGLPSEGGDQFPEGVLSSKERRVIQFERWMYDHFLAKRTIFHDMIHRFIYGFWYLKVFSHFGLAIPREKRVLDAGNWYGNDSCWRMVVDLAKITNFADSNGALHRTRKRKLFSVIDGVIGGENNGPLSPDPKRAGVLIAGENFLATDIVATRLMGFDPLKIKKFVYLLNSKFHFGPKNFSQIQVESNIKAFSKCFNKTKDRFLNFKPHPGWVNHIEI